MDFYDMAVLWSGENPHRAIVSSYSIDSSITILNFTAIGTWRQTGCGLPCRVQPETELYDENCS
jgi:hypothetical protein